MAESPLSSTATRVIITAACIVVVVAGLKVAAPVLIRVALALFIVVVTRPAIAWLQRHRVPPALAITAVILLTFAIIAGVVSVGTQSLGEIRVAFPRYLAALEAMEESLLAALRARNIEVPPAFHLDIVNAQRAVDLAGGALRGAAGVMTSAALILIIAIFGMIEANGLPSKLRRAFGADDEDIARIRDVIDEVQHFLGIKTVISAATGFLVGVWVWLVGLDFPVFWGLVAFLLNYVPSVGSIIAAVPAVGLALVQLGPNGALFTALGYLAVNVVLGNVVEPTMMGRRLGLSPLVIILSLVFWGWLWGPIGILLSVPLTMTVRMLLENIEGYTWVAVLLAPTGEMVRDRPKRPPTRVAGQDGRTGAARAPVEAPRASVEPPA